MSKKLFIAEKPSVARQFADALKVSGAKRDGYIESEDTLITWCVGHLIAMSYPEAYGEQYRTWRAETLPFLPKEFKYEVIASSAKQYEVVRGLLTRPDVDTVYVCTDSGREGEYIYRLVAQMAGVKDKTQKRVWIDSQTEEEILRGIREAKDEAAYDSLSDAAYLRAKEDYLMGINFSRALTVKYSAMVSACLGQKHTVLSAGRVMTCVLGMVVRREREIRDFVKTAFYRVVGRFRLGETTFEAEWKAVPGSGYFETPFLYRENGFKEKKDALALIDRLKTASKGEPPLTAKLASVEKKKELKKPPLLYNLAELQNDCSKLFKISPDRTLAVAQELYEKKLITYPRTDARVLSSAAAKEITKNIRGLKSFAPLADVAAEILEGGYVKGIEKTRYVNDSQVTDHYCLVPTGAALAALRTQPALNRKIYELIARRFLSIFYPPAVYRKYTLKVVRGGEAFFAGMRILEDPGYLKVADPAKSRQGTVKEEGTPEKSDTAEGGGVSGEVLAQMKKNDILFLEDLRVKEGETTPPKRYTSGGMILAMENAGQLIEDEELRAQIKGSGIGTSATRAEILKKLFSIDYLSLSAKTQIITPTLKGELIYDVVDQSIRQLLNPALTASWEKGLTLVADGKITSGEYMQKMERFVAARTEGVFCRDRREELRVRFGQVRSYYKEGSGGGPQSRKRRNKEAL